MARRGRRPPSSAAMLGLLTLPPPAARHYRSRPRWRTAKAGGSPRLPPGGGPGRMRWRSGRMAADVGRPGPPPLTHGPALAKRGGAEARGAAWRGELSRCADVTAPPERGSHRCPETRLRRGEPADNGGGLRGRLCPRAQHGAGIVVGLSAAGPSFLVPRVTTRKSPGRAQGPASRGGAERAQQPSRTRGAGRDSLISI